MRADREPFDFRIGIQDSESFLPHLQTGDWKLETGNWKLAAWELASGN